MFCCKSVANAVLRNHTDCIGHLMVYQPPELRIIELWNAIRNKHYEVVDYLLSVKLYLPDDVFRELLNKPRDWNRIPFLMVVSSYLDGYIDKFVAAGLDLYNDTIYTALIYACNYGNIRNIEMILNIAEADGHFEYINSQSNSGTALIVAAKRYLNCTAVELLVQHGCNVNLCDAFGNTALFYAAQGCTKCTQVLLDAGAITHNIHPDTPPNCIALIKIHMLRDRINPLILKDLRSIFFFKYSHD